MTAPGPPYKFLKACIGMAVPLMPYEPSQSKQQDLFTGHLIFATHQLTEGDRPVARQSIQTGGPELRLQALGLAARCQALGVSQFCQGRGRWVWCKSCKGLGRCSLISFLLPCNRDLHGTMHRIICVSSASPWAEFLLSLRHHPEALPCCIAPSSGKPPKDASCALLSAMGITSRTASAADPEASPSSC